MARIRTIKPTFFTSLPVADLNAEARLTFVGLWTYVDDYGIGTDDARLVKAAVWPLDERSTSDIENDLRAIEATGMLCRYVVNGKPLLHVMNWDEHQTISHKGRSTGAACPVHHESSGPPPPGSGETPEDVRSVPEDFSTAPETFRPEGKGERGKGKGERNTGGAPASLCLVPAPPPNPDPFDAFWERYPRRTDRKKSATAFRAASSSPDEILAGLERWCTYWVADRTEMRYVPHPTTWLRGERWHDTPPLPSRPTPVGSADRSLDAILATAPGPALGRGA